MSIVRLTDDEPHTDAHSPAAPDWRHDPRELADSVRRRAARRRRSRVGAAVAAVLLVLAGVGYVGFVTGWVAIPGLGTLTSHPADVSSFSVGDTTYWMQVDTQDDKTVVVSRQTGKDSSRRVAGVPVPTTDAGSVAAFAITPTDTHPLRSTYVTVLPAGARDVRPEPKSPQSLTTAHEGVVRTSPTGATLLGVVVTVDPPDGAPSAPWQPGLAALHWTDADGHQYVSLSKT